MFTIKWTTNSGNYRCLAVREFEVSRSSGDTNVLMHVIGEDSHWEWKVKPGEKVFVENAMGKTIDVIRVDGAVRSMTPIPE